MTDRIVPLEGDHHREIQSLLPWYLAGCLKEAEHAAVSAHLAGCAECQAELRAEQRAAPERRRPVGETGARLDVERRWTEMSARLNAEAARAAETPARSQWLGRTGRRWLGRGAWMRWALLAQSALIAALAVFLWQGRHTAAPSRGDIAVTFRPDTPEQDLRRILREGGGQVVNGPTDAGAYFIRVPSGEREAALARLRGRTQVVRAAPVAADRPS